MIQPNDLLDHARRLAGNRRGRPPDVDVRRGISAAYYAVFHEITGRAAQHLIGSASLEDQNAIRRAWSHGEVAAVASIVVERAKAVAASAAVPKSKEAREWGPLVDIAADDADLVEMLRLFDELQTLRHRADYDHDASFDKFALVTACHVAERARSLLAGSTAASREALFSLLTVRRKDFRER